ncbi:MAG: DUF4097 family beta strand repeat protein [Chloroflexota bacterium]|nr:MAG: DUF4097 family beta strand repeat protein [Chloroflexota bacterium]
MNGNTRNLVGLLMLVAILFLATSCDINTLEIGPLQTDSETVEIGAAEEASVELSLGAGRLEIGGGAEDFMDAQFTYNVEAWKPEVSYDVSDGFGRLTVDQPDTRDLPLDMGEIQYEWDLRFNDSLPIDMEITMGAGDGQLELDSLMLNSLRFEGGAGDIEVDLSSSTVRDLDIRMGAGDVSVDLSGDWQQDLSANMQGGVGRATVILPGDAGVRVDVRGGLGQVNAAGFHQDGNVYTNDAYGQSEVTLEVDIEGGVGEINLELAE